MREGWRESETKRERERESERESTEKEPWGENRRDMERAGDRTRKSSDGKQRDGEGVTKQSVTIAREPASQSEALRERASERESARETEARGRYGKEGVGEAHRDGEKNQHYVNMLKAVARMTAVKPCARVRDKHPD